MEKEVTFQIYEIANLREEPEPHNELDQAIQDLKDKYHIQDTKPAGQQS